MASQILIQLDADPQASSFDSVVAIDAGVDHLLRHSQVSASSVVPLVHGAMFTRGGDDLRNTAIFIGGSDVEAAQVLFEKAQSAFFGPVRVSIMFDANGCNTTAAAAVATATKHMTLDGCRAIVMGGTGPVGRRVALLLALQGASTVLVSRSLPRAEAACHDIQSSHRNTKLEAAAPADADSLADLLSTADLLVGCGAAGAELVSESLLKQSSRLRLAIDLNAVPPAGIGGIAPFDKAKLIHAPESELLVYGAIGVGGLKMKIHKAAIKQLFESNDRILDAVEIFELAMKLVG